MIKKPKRGRPHLKAKRQLHPGCTVAKHTGAKLRSWRKQLSKVEPGITRGRMLDRLVELAEARMDESVRLTLEAAKIQKAQVEQGRQIAKAMNKPDRTP